MISSRKRTVPLFLVAVSFLGRPGVTEEAWSPVGPNLVQNPSFEDIAETGIPAEWRASPEYYRADSATVHEGGHALKYDNDDPTRYVFCNQVLALKPGAVYRIRAWVKTREITGDDSGATICLEWRGADGKHLGGCYPSGVKGTTDWTLVEGISPPLPKNAATMVIQCYVRRKMTGTAWFDDVEVVRVRTPPMDSVVLSPVYRGRITKDGPKAARVRVDLSLDDYEDVRKEGVRLEWNLVDTKTDGVLHDDVCLLNSADMPDGWVFEVPTDSLAVGEYSLRLRLLDENGNELDADEHRLTRVPDDFEPVAAIDEHQRLIVRSKPFFPIGMYCGRLNEEDLKIFSDSRFNCMMPYGTPTREEMDLADRYGIKVLYSIKDWYYGHRGCPKWIESIEEEEPAVRGRVREMKDHPALLAWYLNDELPLSFMRQLNAHQRFVREEDPDHPTWVVLYQVNTVRKYVNSFDVIGTDPYPIGRSGDQGRPSMAADWTKITREQVYNARPMWQVPQAFNWGIYRQNTAGWDPADFRSPTKAELRSMTWQCITEGATGIIYYCWHNLRRNPDMPFDEFWGNLKEVAAEVDRFSPILLSVEPAAAIRVQSADSEATPTWLHPLVRAADGKTYLFTANDGDGEGVITIWLPEGVSSVRELTEDLEVEIGEGRFHENSQRLEVKVYEILKR